MTRNRLLAGGAALLLGSAGLLCVGTVPASAAPVIVPKNCGIYSGSPVPSGYNLIDLRAIGNFTAGTSGNDFVIGTDQADTIYTGFGSDIVCGRGEADFVDAGGDQDIVYGGPGGDTLYGGLEHDYIHGDGGDDTIHGDQSTGPSASDGPDILYGDEDDDTIYGDGGDDQLYGNLGADNLYGNDGTDVGEGGGTAKGTKVDYCDTVTTETCNGIP